MIEEFRISGFDLVLVLILGMALYAVMKWIRSRLRVLPVSKPRRALLDRLRPLVEALITIVYLVVAVRIVFSGQPLYSTIVLALLTLGFIWLGWFALRDVVAGMLIKAGELCLPGDYIEVGDIGGRVRGLGYRVVALDTADGGQAFVPYSRITRETLVRKPVTDGVFQHCFRVRLTPTDDVVERKESIRRHALNSHWHSVVREPRIEVSDDGSFTVTVFAIAPNQGHRIEREIRHALARQASA